MHTHTFIAAGGGTGGSISPLLALLEAFPGSAVHWLGTRGHWKGEQEMVESVKGSTFSPSRSNLNHHIEFHPIFSGKLRRYWDLNNFVDPFFVLLGFFQSLWILARCRPCAVLTAGSYVAVPVAWAAWILRIPVVMYQQDVEIGLANRLIAPVASLILCVREEDQKRLSNYRHCEGRSRSARGNPVVNSTGALIRSDRINGDPARARTLWSLEADIPTLLILGGGTGSEFLNTLVAHSMNSLSEIANIVHFYGRGSYSDVLENIRIEDRGGRRYHPVEFLAGQELADVYAAANLVLTRAGMGVLTELAANKKAAVVIPLPNTHQEANAQLLVSHNAAVFFSQSSVMPSQVEGSRLTSLIHSLLTHPHRRAELAANLHALFPVANKKEVTDLIIYHACSENV